jgi:hypothetical protein
MRKHSLNKTLDADEISDSPARGEHGPVVLIEEELARAVGAGTRPGACVSSGSGVKFNQ